MAEPIRKTPISAPTPQNTPASVSSMQRPPTKPGASMASISEQGGLEGLSTNPALMSLIQGRLGTLVGRSSGYIESLPQETRDRLAALKALRIDQQVFEGEFQRDLLELEKKYATKYAPLYQRRTKIVTGDAEPKPDEVEKGEQAFQEEKEMFDDENEENGEDSGEGEDSAGAAPDSSKASGDKGIAEEDEETPLGVPNFWLTAMKNLPPLAGLISERDDEILQYLSDIRLKYLEKPGFALEFEFTPNPAFSNNVLVKSYFYREEIGMLGDLLYDHAEGTNINWTSPEANVTQRIEKRKQRNKHTKATRTIEKTLPEESFFNFFSPPKPPADSDEEEIDEYDEELHDQLEEDFELGDLFKEKLIPRAIDWFTGRALDYEQLASGQPLEDEDEDSAFDDEEEGDDEEGDEDDEGSVAEGTKKEVPPECKQQ